ncbi:nuclease-related domain-containing protein [Gluconobacter cerinus]|uniref:nuclease-related domain-containing protein n=1 Tax=Gluconobacter cerinus TaxID=38307 RepID=UPI001B8C95B9|nr:nuclease-related domain-containing protein [Gluconobacter cerinus]MBS0984382.1 NERD domain-containing protein [Gluconobacter cerinus]
MVRLRLRPRGGPSRIERSDSAHAAWKSLQAELKGAKGEDRIRTLLNDLGRPSLHDVRLPKASGDGTTQIDHLVLLPRALMVIETKHYAGHLSGHPNDEYWRQRLGKEEAGRLIYSPLRQNAGHCAAVRAVTSQACLDVEILSRVVLTGRASVTAALQASVRTPDALANELKQTAGEASGLMMGLWQRLLRVAHHTKK